MHSKFSNHIATTYSLGKKQAKPFFLFMKEHYIPLTITVVDIAEYFKFEYFVYEKHSFFHKPLHMKIILLDESSVK